MRLVRASILCAALFLLCSFFPQGKPNNAALAKHFQSPPVVLYDRGSMKEIYKDNAAAKVKLSDLKSTEHLYALGPLSGLRGEILIWDSQAFESRAKKGQVQLKQDWDESAAFLVWASVPKWKKILVPEAVVSIGLLEQWIQSMSGSGDFPLRQQFPFLLKGRFGRLVWHVVNVQDDGKALTPQKHEEQKFHGQSLGAKAEILGFYSPQNQGIYIPKGRAIHMHVKVGEELVAHVDDFDPTVSGQLSLYVPAQ